MVTLSYSSVNCKSETKCATFLLLRSLTPLFVTRWRNRLGGPIAFRLRIESSAYIMCIPVRANILRLYFPYFFGRESIFSAERKISAFLRWLLFYHVINDVYFSVRYPKKVLAFLLQQNRANTKTESEKERCCIICKNKSFPFPYCSVTISNFLRKYKNAVFFLTNLKLKMLENNTLHFFTFTHLFLWIINFYSL